MPVFYLILAFVAKKYFGRKPAFLNIYTRSIEIFNNINFYQFIKNQSKIAKHCLDLYK